MRFGRGEGRLHPLASLPQLLRTLDCRPHPWFASPPSPRSRVSTSWSSGPSLLSPLPHDGGAGCPRSLRWRQREPRLETAQARSGGRDGSGDVPEAREECRGRRARGRSGVGPALCSAACPGEPRVEAAPSSRPKPADQRLPASRVRLPRRLIWTSANSPKGRCGSPGPPASKLRDRPPPGVDPTRGPLVRSRNF